MTARAMRVMIIGTMTNPSGAPIAALRLASGLAERGHAVEAVFLYDLEAVEGGDYPYRALLPHPPRSPLDFARITLSLARAIRAFRPDAVLTFLPFASILACTLARVVRVPIRIVSHRVPCDTYTPAMRTLDRWAARTGSYTDVVAVSASVARSCAGYPEWLSRNIRVVYNGLKGWRASPLDRAAARRRFGLAEGGLLAVAVGRIDRQKNYPVLIDALAGANPVVALAIAGDGSDRDDLIRRIASCGLNARVHLLGNIARTEIPHLLAAADIFVQPSLFEGQSNALLEALHAGLPCFVSDAPEQVETVTAEDGAVAGRILPVADAARWRAAFDGIASQSHDTAIAATIESRAATFTFPRMIDGFETVLRARFARPDQ